MAQPSTPANLTELFAEPAFQQLLEALLPPAPLRARQRFEVEIERPKDGTYRLVCAEGAVSVQRGFAKAPLLSVRVDGVAFGVAMRLLQAARTGFADAPELARLHGALRKPAPGELDAVVDALLRLAPMALELALAEGGTVTFARGPVDEADRLVRITVAGKALEALAAGAAVRSLMPRISGDRTVLAAAAAALGPLRAVLGVVAGGAGGPA